MVEYQSFTKFSIR